MPSYKTSPLAFALPADPLSRNASLRSATALSARSKRRTIPDWSAVQRAEDADKTLIDLWREYAAHAAQPYALSAFRKEFRKWQASAPAEPAAEFAASDHYWQGKTLPRPDILVVDDGATLRARGGHLEVYSRRATIRFDAGPHHRKPKAIIFAGWGGSFSIAASRFCIDHRITVRATGWLGDLLTFIAPRPVQDAALVRAQCFARPAPIAREIVIQKFRHYQATRRMTSAQFRDFEARLIRARTVAAILGVEAVGSSLSWVHWEGLQTHAAHWPDPPYVARSPIPAPRKRDRRIGRPACDGPNQRDA